VQGLAQEMLIRIPGDDHRGFITASMIGSVMNRQ
jgi:hypothetical protein